MTSLHQTLSEVYISECSSLKMKPNSVVVHYLHEKEQQHGDAAHIPELNFSKNFLGRKGVLPLLTVILRCVSLRLLNLNGVGLTDLACSLLAETLGRHPSVCVVYLKENFITADSLPSLKRLTFAFLERAERSTSTAAFIKRKNDETEFEIHIDPNPGIYESVVAELAVVRRTANKADLEAAKAAPVPASAVSPTSTTTGPQGEVDSYYDKKHSRMFAKSLAQIQRRLQQEAIYNAKLGRRVKPNSEGWIILGVYFSSTFAEFPDEAQLIHRKLMPLLNFRLRPLKVHLVPVMLHTMEDEDFRMTNTFQADGGMPIHSGRLPPFRKTAQQWADEDSGENGVLWNASSSEVAEVREFAIRDACDIFVALHSDMYNPSCHAVDWSALETSPDNGAIPTLLFKRNVHCVPPGLQHLFDYKANLQQQLADNSHALEHGNGPKPKLADLISERKILVNDFVLFKRRVEERIPHVMRHEYHANYSHVDANGIARFTVDDSFFSTMSQDIFCAALAYRQKRLSGLSDRPTVLLPPLECPTIGKQNWRGGHINANPFAHLEHKLGADDPERSREPFFTKDISEKLVVVGEDDIPGGPLFQAIYGQRGMGRTTQLRASSLRIQNLKHKNANMIVSHSVTSGCKTLLGVMTGILQQLVAPNSPVFPDWPSFDDDDAMCRAFCDALRTRSSIPRFISCLWILIDDDDAVEFGSSFAEAFQTAERCELLCSSMPHEGMQLRVLFTTNSRPKPHHGLSITEVPTFDEIEAADLFVSIMLGIDKVPEAVLEEVKHTAHYLVLHKKHGTKPQYLQLAAREMLQTNEEMSMVNIAEQLPGTVEELLAAGIRGTLPKDMTAVLDAIALSPTPMDGAMIRHAISPCRRTPSFSAVAAARTWFSKRRWGNFTSPAMSSGCLLIAFLVNFAYLFANSTRSRNRGVYTNPRTNFFGSIWRTDLTLASRTIAEALSSRPKERRAISDRVLPANVWETALLRVTLVRDDVHVTRGLSNYFDAMKFFSTPHRLFALLSAHRPDELRLVVERLLLLLCADGGALSADGTPQRLTSHHVRSKLNELRVSQQFAANEPDGLLRHARQNPLALLMEYTRYFMENWEVLLRHPMFLYACPQYAPPVVSSEIDAAISTYNTACLRRDCCFSFAKRCYETALLLTSQAQEQPNTSEVRGNTTAAHDASADALVTGGPRLKTFLVASRVSKSFVVTYRSITDAKPHEITPTMASPSTSLAPADDENGGKSFGYVGVVLMPAESASKTNADFGFSASKNFAQVSLGKGAFFLSVKAHVNAISALDIVETRHAVRIASAAYYDTEIVITALIVSRHAGDASRLQMVGRLQLQNVQRPMIASIGMSPVTQSQLPDRGADDGQRCPMVCVAVKNMLYVFEGQRFGHDNLYNRKGSIAPQVYSGHDNRIVHHGFSPAGAKVFSIDVSGHCFVWGTPESPCSGTILAVTDFGAVPTFARFVDHESLMVVTSRGILLWNSGSSQVQQLLTNPTRQQLDGNYAMLHFQPPPYVYGSLEDTELLQLPPHVKVHRLLEQLREKKHPTVTYMSFDGITIFDAAEKQLRVFKRQHIPPQNELECDQPPILLFAKEASHSCPILPHVSTSDTVGNADVENWRWFLGSRSAVAIDTKENIVKCFELLKGQQVPLFYAVKSDVPSTMFSVLDDVALAGEGEDRIVVAERQGTIHVLTKTPGALLYPVPPLTTM
jgi:hypothetical protein